jgi:GMP synthase (glutamine-hydrolysing)
MPEQTVDGWILPVKSVGVQGDARSYRPVLAVEELDREMATHLVNRLSTINRVIAVAGTSAPLRDLSVRECSLTPARLDKLRRADAVVRRFSEDHGFEAKVWQFPVVLIPVGTATRADSVVLRPIYSMDGMTADPVLMDRALLRELSRELLSLGTLAAVFYDLTSKPPATIEWE